MSKLEELKRLAETADTCSELWFQAQDIIDDLRRTDLSGYPDEDGRYIAAISPATTLKLLEMIAVLRKAIAEHHAEWDDDNTPQTCKAVICQALRETEEIERSL